MASDVNGIKPANPSFSPAAIHNLPRETPSLSPTNLNGRKVSGEFPEKLLGTINSFQNAHIKNSQQLPSDEFEGFEASLNLPSHVDSQKIKVTIATKTSLFSQNPRNPGITSNSSEELNSFENLDQLSTNDDPISNEEDVADSSEFDDNDLDADLASLDRLEKKGTNLIDESDEEARSSKNETSLSIAKEAESARHSAESAKHSAESAKHSAESARYSAESTVHTAESEHHTEISAEYAAAGTEHTQEATELGAEAMKKIEHFSHEALFFGEKILNKVGLRVDKDSYFSIAQTVISEKAQFKGSANFDQTEMGQIGSEIFLRIKKNKLFFNPGPNNTRLPLSAEQEKYLEIQFNTLFSQHFIERNLIKETKPSHTEEKTKNSQATNTQQSTQANGKKVADDVDEVKDEALKEIKIEVNRERRFINELEIKLIKIFQDSMKEQREIDRRDQADQLAHDIIVLDILHYEISKQELKNDILKKAITSDAIVRNLIQQIKV